jgi:hypothetical protein
MDLPPDLLQGLVAAGGGKITLVVGAGCSWEAPTSIPLAGTCSQESHDRLVANGVLANGECATPSNLSCLADTVFGKTGAQRLLVEQLSQHYPLHAATPNEGHLLAAALLREGAIASVLTLNFDLALSMAIGWLGVGDAVAIINGPNELPNQMAFNLYYLHRNVTAADPEAWILRTSALQVEWKGQWETVVAAKVLAAPIVVFAGLGSPADVLIETSKLIQKAIPNGHKAYQVDPVDRNHSAFFNALALDPAFYIQATWCEFMAALSQRLVIEQVRQLEAAANGMITREELHAENLTHLVERLQAIGLLKLGGLRASWLLYEKRYFADTPLIRELLADLLLVAALIARVTGTTPILFEDGVVEFRRDDRTVATHVFASGMGSRSIATIEGELSKRQRLFRGRATYPNGAIVAGTRQNIAAPITAPPDVVVGETSASIIYGPSVFPLFHADTLRQDPRQCSQVAP